MNKLILGIDVTNIRHGGGITHIAELLSAANPLIVGFCKVIVWGSEATLSQIEPRAWLEKVNSCPPQYGLIRRSLWQIFRLPTVAKQAKCDVLFVPGGIYVGNFHPFVTMSQNLLPFEWGELRRYGFSTQSLKLILLRLIQSSTFRRADGIIFLTEYSFGAVNAVIRQLLKVKIVPHGLNKRFFIQPRMQKSIYLYKKTPFNLLYVSTVDQYKHQWNVVEAVAALRNKHGWNIALNFVGSSYSPALSRLQHSIEEYDVEGKWIKYWGAIKFNELHNFYRCADLGVFASSCENMPNILLEMMAAGLPIACSRYGPMPEILGGSGLYFDPENIVDIENAIRDLIQSKELREKYAGECFSKAKNYSWYECSKDTLTYIKGVTTQSRRKRP